MNSDTTSTQSLIITRPDDWHLHLRDGSALEVVLPHTASQFARAVIMPNLKPPVTTTALALEYRERILAALPKGLEFEPLMTLYLTDVTQPEEIKTAFEAGVVSCKLYPSGATTNSDSGVTRIENIYPVLEAMQRYGLKLLIHAEVTDPEVDLFDREAVFIERHLKPLRSHFPELKVVFEHITTQDAVEFVKSQASHTAATLTAHHLLLNRNAIFVGGVRPHYYCLPVLKRERHRLALLAAATSADPRFFLGTDSAPHAAHLKEHECGCAGCYTAASAMELYAQAFESVQALDKLEGFASFFGADFYGLPRNKGHLILRRESWQLPESFPYGGDQLKPLFAKEKLSWRVVGQSS